MKKSLYCVLFFAGLISILWTYKNLLDLQAVQPKPEKGLYPNEWMYNQRAYPNDHIDQKVAIESWKSAQTARKTFSKSTGLWELRGPLNIGGRVTDIAISPDDDDIFFIGTAVGGVFKTVDRGQNWSPVFDNAGRPSIGNIAIAQSNSQRIYVGTGEANGSATSGAFFGDGMYRSDDGGDNWIAIGLEESNHIGRIVVDPVDQDRVFAATTGVLYGSSSTRGLYRTEDGGANWEQVLFVSDTTACIDVVMNPENTDILYASTWERRRRPWIRDYGGETSGVYRSIDGGDNWELLTNGLPISDSETGRIGLSISKTDPSIIYASYTTNSITNTYDGLYRSTNGGDSWELAELDAISDVNSTFGWYFGNVRVNPYNEEDIHVLGQQLYRTQNDAASWSSDVQMHVDFHALEWSSQNQDMILCGNDGGLYISENNGQNWSQFVNLPITQFYHMEVDESDPEQIYGGAQDNNTIRTTTGELDDYEAILGGDGFQVSVDPTDNDFVYAEYQFGVFFRSEDNALNMEYAIGDIPTEDRTNWNTPAILSPYDPEILYYGSNKLYRSDDRALTWYPISDDLTGGQHPSGASSFGTLTTLAASGANDGVIYTGSDDGKVHVTFDGGANWELVSNNLPNRYVTGLAIDPNDDLTAYLTYSGYGYLDYSPHVFKTNDGGQSWTDISGDLPNIPVNDILIQANPFRIFIATDNAVWYSEDEGLNWLIVGNNLPPTIMTHLQYHEGTDQLFVGTFGRSIHSFDLSQLESATSTEELVAPTISIYPNPAREVITISTDELWNGPYFITDLKGAIVKEGTFGNGSNETRIDVRELGMGNYIFHAQMADRWNTIQFQKSP